MTPPKRVWVTDGDDDTPRSVSNCPVPGASEYRLVKPKRETLAYVVKRGELYLYGAEFLRARVLAERWSPDDVSGALTQAEEMGEGARIIRLVRRSTP